MPRFSANLSLLFPDLHFIERFKAAKTHGFDAVEIQFPYSETAWSIKEQLQRHQLHLVLFNVDADDLLLGGEGLASVPEKRDQFRGALAQAVEYAEILKPDVINVLPGRAMNKQRNQEYLETFKNNLSLAIEHFAPLGITTVFEAINTDDMPGFLVHSGQQMLDIIKQIKHPQLAMQYDLYHMAKMGENIPAFIGQYSDHIAHIQFADCPGRSQPGTGQLDLKRIFGLLDELNYARWVGAEYNPTGSTAASLYWLTEFCTF